LWGQSLARQNYGILSEIYTFDWGLNWKWKFFRVSNFFLPSFSLGWPARHFYRLVSNMDGDKMVKSHKFERFLCGLCGKICELWVKKGDFNSRIIFMSEKLLRKKGEIFFSSFLEWNFFSLIREEEKRKFNAYNCHHLCLCTTSITNTSFNEKFHFLLLLSSNCFFCLLFCNFVRKIEKKRKIVICKLWV
jgi:hypothetical protein